MWANFRVDNYMKNSIISLGNRPGEMDIAILAFPCFFRFLDCSPNPLFRNLAFLKNIPGMI